MSSLYSTLVFALPVAELGGVRRLRSISMTLISNSLARPAYWLLGAFCVVSLCFWVPFFYIGSFHDPHLARAAGFRMILPFPLAAIASLVALLSYICLWRIVLRLRDARSWCSLAVASVVFLLAAVPGLMIVFTILVLIFSPVA